MTDVLHRLQQALPAMRDWLDTTLSAYAGITVPVSTLKVPRLAAYYPVEWLARSRIAVVRAIPRPPVSDFGLPEFEPMTAMEIGGITYRDTFFADEGQVTESLCFHEMIHIVQWAMLGVDDFLLTYGVGLLQHGYAESPLEAIAYAAQSGFDAGTVFPDLVSRVAEHAPAARTATSAVFEANGLRMGA